MCSLWTTVAPTMFQRLKLLQDFLGVALNLRHGRAFLELVQASNLRDEDRDLVTRLIRATLRLPDDRVHEPSSPEASAPSAHAARCRQRDSS